MNRDLVKKAYAGATTYCENRMWNSGESTAWVWEEKFAELIVEEVCSELARAGSGLNLTQIAVISDAFGIDE